MHHACAVEQHIDRADRLRRRRDGGRIGDVQRQRADPGAALQALEVDVAGDHLGAGGGEQPGGGKTDPLPGGGDQYAFPG